MPRKVAISVVACLVPLIGLALQVSRSATSVLRDELQQNVGLSTEVDAERIERAVNRTSQGLFEIAFDPAFTQISLAHNDSERGNQAGEFDGYLESVLTRWGADGLVGLAVVDESNELLSQAGALSPETVLLGGTSDLTAEAAKGGAFLIETSPRLPVARRIFPGGRSAESIVLVSEWDIASLLGDNTRVESMAPSTSARLLAPTADGTFLVLDATDRAAIGSYVSFDFRAFEVGSISSGNATTDRLTENGIPVLAAAAEVSNTGWVSVVAVSQNEAYAELKDAQRYIVTVFTLAGLAMIAIGTVVVRSFARRLMRVAQLAEAIAQGDLTVRTDDDSNDALGHLSATFDQMAAALATDIARRERVEAQLAYQATHDSLTGLPNRAQLVEKLDSLLRETEGEISVLFLDLDGFKQVNDRLGHAAGDSLLVRVAQRLREITRPTDIVTRLGGDEFVVVLAGLGVMEAEASAGRIVSALELPYVVGGDEASISASIGIAAAGEDRDSEQILKEADVAMYRAKALGKGRAVHLDADLKAEIEHKGFLLTELREAINSNELDLKIRPICDLRDGTLLGIELVPSWDHPERGQLQNHDLEALIDNAGFATQIDEWTIKTAARAYTRWKERNLPVDGLLISINVCVPTFESPRTRHILARELSHAGMRVSDLRLEVPETVLRGDEAILRDSFDAYRAMGVPVLLDRFGSDLSRIDDAPRYGVESAKIDLGKLRDAASGSPTSQALIASLVNLASSGGLRATASGVDNEFLRGLMLSLGCNQGQGEWISQELADDEFDLFLESRHLLTPG